MKCSTIMQRHVFSMDAHSTVQDVACEMHRRGLDFVPFCGADSRPVGALTDIDVAVRVLLDDWVLTTHVAEIMGGSLALCRVDDDVATAQKIMLRQHVSRLICVDADGKMAGVISMADMAQHSPAGAGDGNPA